MQYHDWLAAKSKQPRFDSIEPPDLNPALFGFQRDLVAWALRRGRAALFADTGLGKTLMQLEWARVVAEQKGRVLILAPLAVSEQTVREAGKFGIETAYRRSDAGDRITVTNYEMLQHFDPSQFAGVVLDESSILKSYDGATRTAIIEAFGATPFRLACTATPAPNDHMELGNHSEFLGVKSRVEMLSEYFVHDGGSTQSWRLKGHAVDHFWRWVCSWAALVKRPSDLGYSDDGFALPSLIERVHAVDLPVEDAWTNGALFHAPAVTLQDQRAERRKTLDNRVDVIASSIAAHPDEPAIVWCDFNIESEALRKAIPGAVEVRGSDTPEDKASRLLAFADGAIRVLVTKASIAGFGMNWQHCNQVYFVGPSHSYEQTYQAIRRCWRFGQLRPVTVHTCVADTEKLVLDNYRRKAKDADEMASRMVAHIRAAGYQSAIQAGREWADYSPSHAMELPSWIA